MPRLSTLWNRTRDSLWFLPGVLTITGATLALVLTGIERRGFVVEGAIGAWVFGGGAEGARGLLAAIASSLITVTGVVFSVTIVALQLASSQYTPRLLRDFTADRGNQLVLGVFIGTFTYTLLVLRTVRSPDEGAGFVPGVAVTLAIVLAIVNIGVLIFFIDHSARSIQVSTILARVTARTRDHIARRFPSDVGRPEPASALPEPQGIPHIVEARRSGYLQHVDGDALFRVGHEGQRLIVMDVEIGSFVLEGTPLARVAGPALTDEVADEIRSAFVVGGQRTPGQDVEFGFIEIADIAVKALSPGINDPTTALHCIDRLAELLLFLGCRSEPVPTRSRTGAVHFIARWRTFEDVARRAIEPIRHFAADQPLVAAALVRALGDVARHVPLARRRVLEQLARDLGEHARESIAHPADRSRIEQLLAAFPERAAAPGAPGVRRRVD